MEEPSRYHDGLLLGGLIIGALKPTNTWDFYTYLVLGIVVLAYAVWRYTGLARFPVAVPDWIKRLLLAAGAVVVLVGASILFYQPYTHWYLLDPTYTKFGPWTGGRSEPAAAAIHWGVFLFFIVSWMAWRRASGWPERLSPRAGANCGPIVTLSLPY